MTKEQADKVKQGDKLTVFLKGRQTVATVCSIKSSGIASPHFRFNEMDELISWRLCALPGRAAKK